MKNKVMVSMFTLASISILLTACGQKTEKQSSSSSSTVEQSTKTSESKASKSKTATKSEMKDSATKASSDTATPAEKMPSASASQEKTEEASSAPTSSESTIDLNALVNGDFSSIAGTWQNDVGSSITFDANGVTSVVTKNVYTGETYSSDSVPLDSPRVDERGWFVVGLGQGMGSEPLMVIPRGVTFMMDNVTRNQDVIQIGTDAAYATYHPYYKIN
ncbi:DUF6287 domain-containing protein [Streptococcus himalayensis]|uniref:DUF6287 domain-containing protein n=1 Tax=Streptococcus himalayensis TaxID=1888195 RepID=UPI00083E658A|nr:DUF6287 domain-containing protein [Streptococcus himalayensis]